MAKAAESSIGNARSGETDEEMELEAIIDDLEALSNRTVKHTEAELREAREFNARFSRRLAATKRTMEETDRAWGLAPRA